MPRKKKGRSTKFSVTADVEVRTGATAVLCICMSCQGLILGHKVCLRVSRHHKSTGTLDLTQAQACDELKVVVAELAALWSSFDDDERLLYFSFDQAALYRQALKKTRSYIDGVTGADLLCQVLPAFLLMTAKITWPRLAQGSAILHEIEVMQSGQTRDHM